MFFRYTVGPFGVYLRVLIHVHVECYMLVGRQTG